MIPKELENIIQDFKNFISIRNYHFLIRNNIILNNINDIFVANKYDVYF